MAQTVNLQNGTLQQSILVSNSFAATTNVPAPNLVMVKLAVPEILVPMVKVVLAATLKFWLTMLVKDTFQKLFWAALVRPAVTFKPLPAKVKGTDGFN